MKQYLRTNIELTIFFSCLQCLCTIIYVTKGDFIENENSEAANKEPLIFLQGVEGKPGIDFPVLTSIPRTSFSCRDTESGYYADLETRCQVFHICEEGKKISFLCPNGTIFQQSDLICDWWFKVNCTNSPLLYEESSEQLKEESVRRKAARRISVKNINDNISKFQNPKHDNNSERRKNSRTDDNTSHHNSFTKPFNNPKLKIDLRAEEFNSFSTTVSYRLSGKDGPKFSRKSTGELNDIKQKNNDLDYITPNTGNQKPILQNIKENPHSYRDSTDTNKNKENKIKFEERGGRKIKEFSSHNLTPVISKYDKEKNKKLITIETGFLKGQPTNEDNYVNIFVGSRNKVLKPSVLNSPPTTKEYPCKACERYKYAKIDEKTTSNSSGLKKNDEKLGTPCFEDSRETQIPQESASIVENNNLNRIRENRFEESADYPNHRKTYSDIKDSKYYIGKYLKQITPVTPQYLTTQSFNTGKTFVGARVGGSIPKNDLKDSFTPNSNYTNIFIQDVAHSNKEVDQKKKSYVHSTVAFNTIGYENPVSIEKKTVTPPLNEIYSTSTKSSYIQDRLNTDEVSTPNYRSTEEYNTISNSDQTSFNHKSTGTSTFKYDIFPSTKSNVTLSYENIAKFLRKHTPSLSSNFAALPFDLTSLSKPSTFSSVPPRPFEIASTKPTFPESMKKTLSTSDAELLPYPFFKISTASPFSLSKSENQKERFVEEYTSVTEPSIFVPDIINDEDVSVDDVTKDDSSDLRPGLVVPSSVSPQTLHSLATYFENALENITNMAAMEKLKLGNESISTVMEEELSSLLSNMTRYGYQTLFKDNSPSKDNIEIMTLSETRNNFEKPEHLEDSAKVRKLAKIFSQALSDYLDDPTNFKNTLLKIRPTEPPTNANAFNTEGELLSFSEDDLKSNLSSPYNPPIWGSIYTTETDIRTDDGSNSLSSDPESLSSADSQSFISQFNNLNDEEKQKALRIDNLPNDHWTSSSHATNLWRTTFAVNPNSINNDFQATESYAAFSLPMNDGSEEQAPDIEVADTTKTPDEINYELRVFPKLALNSSQLHGILIDYMNVSKTSDSSRLHRILRKLNTTEDEFLEKMRKMEQNPLTRSLILLLINECDIKNSKNSEQNSTPPLNVDTKVKEDTFNLTPLFSSGNSKEDGLTAQDQDKRALQLLNSLYDVATKFGK